MNYEEKLKEAKRLYQTANSNQKYVLESLFPELKESEDEKIRKALIRFHKSTIDVDGIKGEDIIAWLEKQGTSYTKRDVDDAFVEGMAFAKDELEKQGEQKSILNVPLREVILSIWDLGNEWKELTNGSISTEYGTQLDYIQKHWTESEYYLREKQGEQTINQPDFEIPFGAKDSELIEESYYIPKGFHAEIIKDRVTIKKGEQKPAWSAEDTFKVQRICKYLCEAKKYYADITEVRDCIEWLKSLKQRIGGKK